MDSGKIKKGLLRHLVDSTALCVAGNPIWGALEVTLFGTPDDVSLNTGMSDDLSLHARYVATGLTYAGLGSIISGGRKISRKLFKITDESKERVQQFHDAAYLAAYAAVYCPILYTASAYAASEEPDINEIAIGTGITMAVSFFPIGPIMGYAIDAFEDLTGIEDSERVPEFIRRQNPIAKKGLAALLTAASIGITAGIYALTPDTFDYNNNTPTQYSQGITK
jgi:hypothetical protein